MSVMASKVAVVVTDDIDGSPEAETVTFGLDGTTYEIDLGETNRTKFNAAFAPYIEAGRRISRTPRRSSASRSSGPKVDNTAVRAWAKEHGLKVSERGRLSTDVVQQYEAAH